jgi:putative (di)nucleoside polyphosphate hydrolase
MPSDTYRTNVGAIIREGDRILMCERIEPEGIWQFPQGGVDPGETHVEALWRELGEELGLRAPREALAIVARGPAVPYDFPDDYDAPIARHYRGQMQTLFVLDFSGSDQEFRLDAHHEPEFRSFRWVTVEQAVDLIWDFKRPVLEATLEELSAYFGSSPES